MIARPIPFSPPMVRATIDGKKSQTRRIVKPQPIAGTDALRDIPGENRWWAAYAGKDPTGVTYRPLGSDQQHDWRCPYGMRGDLLWVREPWRASSIHDRLKPSEIPVGDSVAYYADGELYLTGRYRHARFMPRWASRITLRITDVRVELLQEISAEDCIAEGLSTTFREHDAVADLRRQYRELWVSINGPDSWAANPWVWVIAFAVIKANVDEVMKREAA